MSNNAVVQAEGLRKSYRGGSGMPGGSSRPGGSGGPLAVRALDGLSFGVPAGSVYALLGPNGAGKTTTVRILTTLAKPDAGRASVAGTDVVADPGRVRSVIGAVSQHTGAVALLTGHENLELQARLYGVRGRAMRRRVTDLLDQFGLAEAAGRPARTYSGGMRRRLDVAMVLVHRPAVLFLDEPTTGLDPEGRADLWAVLTRLAGESGTTILVTTHYLEEADQFAARVAIVDRGRIVAEGTPGELKAELRGDSVILDLADPAQVGPARKALSPVTDIRGLSTDGALLRARVADGPKSLPTVLAGLEAAQVPVRSVTVTRPSLDEVYLHHAGRSFRQAEGITIS